MKLITGLELRMVIILIFKVHVVNGLSTSSMSKYEYVNSKNSIYTSETDIQQIVASLLDTRNSMADEDMVSIRRGRKSS